MHTPRMSRQGSGAAEESLRKGCDDEGCDDEGCGDGWGISGVRLTGRTRLESTTEIWSIRRYSMR